MAKILHKNRLFRVEEHKVGVSGKKWTAYAAVAADTAAILPVMKKGRILLEKQYRPAIGKTIYEMPAGRMEKGERPLSTAKRELEEETGLRAGKLTYIGSTYPSPGMLSERQYMYIAEQLGKSRLHLDRHERIKLKGISTRDAIHMIKSGKIVDAKTVLAILYYNLFIEGKHKNRKSAGK